MITVPAIGPKSEIKKNTKDVFGDFASELQVKSLETIIKDYKMNPFFKIKVDLLLR